jgi:hypothetical protein
MPPNPKNVRRLMRLSQLPLMFKRKPSFMLSHSWEDLFGTRRYLLSTFASATIRKDQCSIS